MRLLLLASLAIVACSDASNVRPDDRDLEAAAPVALEAATDTTDYYRAQGDPTLDPRAEPSPFRSTGRCREIAQGLASGDLASGEYEVFDAVPDHTFAFRTARDRGACFVPLFLPQNASQIPPGEPWPYQYVFVIDENGETRFLEVEIDPSAGAIEAVGFEDVNGDGTDDIFIVHDGDASTLAFASDVDDLVEGDWYQLLVDNGQAGIFVETVAELKDAWRDQVQR